MAALAALTAVAAGPAGMPSPPPDAIRAKSDEVFARPEFHSSNTESGLLLRLLREFFAWLGGLYETAPLLFWLILVGCIVILLALVTHIVLTVRAVFVKGRVNYEPTGDGTGRLLLSAGYRQEADRRAAAGEFTEAVRFLFLALVYRFDERGRVSLHKAYTNREYLELLGDRPTVRDALRVMVDALDDHWYGQRSCGPAMYRDCLAVYDRLAAST
jgi:hypothetical protein